MYMFCSLLRNHMTIFSICYIALWHDSNVCLHFTSKISSIIQICKYCLNWFISAFFFCTSKQVDCVQFNDINLRILYLSIHWQCGPLCGNCYIYSFDHLGHHSHVHCASKKQFTWHLIIIFANVFWDMV